MIGYDVRKYFSKLFFNKLSDFKKLENAINDKNLQLFDEDDGLFPHLERIHYDELSETLTCFANFYTI